MSHAPIDETAPLETNKKSWRVVDIVVAAVLGVACGLIFVGWNALGGAWYAAMDALTPGIGGIACGIWLLGGVLGGLIIRKPGAAIFVEVVAATLSALVGNQWGITTLYSGLAQGIGAELIFAMFAYKNFKMPVAMLSGVGAAILEWVMELFVFGNLEKGPLYNTLYLVTMAISGAILAGVLGRLLTTALAKTGVLNRFAAGADA